MIELLHKILPGRKTIDRYMINNVRIHACTKRLELDSANIDIDPKYFNTTFIIENKDTSGKYFKGKYV